jgi:D-beta-D-heptose 7-phosphate kinase/D-beta-D-heptose 1-phosphate adenosyltransferase
MNSVNSGKRESIALIGNRWDDRRVLVIGDVMLDKYICGIVERISPEAPVPVVHATRATHSPGGAANVAMNVVGLGAKATVIGFVGEDEDAEALKEDLTAFGVSLCLVSLPDFSTTSKLRILSNNQQMLRVDFEETGSRPQAAYQKLIEQAREVMPSCSAVVLSDYAKGALSDLVCATIIREARMLGIPILVDPKSASFEKYRNATTVCPNLQEMAIAAQNSTKDLAKLLDICELYVNQFGFDFLTVTLAEKGIAVVGKGLRKRIPATARQVFDVSGAGDTVIATLALCLACGLDVEAAIELANVTAGTVISKVGTVPAERNEVMWALSENTTLHREEKIIVRDQLLARVATWRGENQRIVFTNGCYDLLHVGHINLLERAQQQGDRLIVAINSDDSVRRLKGLTRPIVGEHERAKVLAALSAVDVVTVFNESTPLELIRALRPDVLVKGDDYKENEVVGAADVISWGGRVFLVPIVEGFSTSELITQAAGRSGL